MSLKGSKHAWLDTTASSLTGIRTLLVRKGSSHSLLVQSSLLPQLMSAQPNPLMCPHACRWQPK